MKEILVDNHDESRSRVGSETPMEDLTMDQYIVEEAVTGALKKGAGEKQTDSNESTVAPTPATNREADGRQKHY